MISIFSIFHYNGLGIGKKKSFPWKFKNTSLSAFQDVESVNIICFQTQPWIHLFIKHFQNWYLQHILFCCCSLALPLLPNPVPWIQVKFPNIILTMRKSYCLIKTTKMPQTFSSTNIYFIINSEFCLYRRERNNTELMKTFHLVHFIVLSVKISSVGVTTFPQATSSVHSSRPCSLSCRSRGSAQGSRWCRTRRTHSPAP